MTPAPEIWGGVECSIVRVGGAICDQLRETGHFDREADLDLLAPLGIRKIRYPVLWEIVEAVRGRDDWTWPDARLGRLRQLGVEPIAGLVHHGSGPTWTDILDPAFPDLLADYASRVARRYPWLKMYTPVNEPLTTARISGLYRMWHPHGGDEATCLRLVAAECCAIRRSMKAIRKFTPAARLVQTEDFGRVFSTPRLAYQAEHENERRWLAVDLLAGIVDRHHPFFGRLLEAGVSRRLLDEMVDEPCPPDVIGLDYYLTSDRFLDDRIELYPGEPPGGNGLDRYVDIAAIRSADAENDVGLQKRLEEVWGRYSLPVAVTELHNGCTRDEQLRWLVEGWEGALAAGRSGAEVVAVTSWSLFGAVDWNSMLTERSGYYESGAFDARFLQPRRTIIGQALAGLSSTGTFDHPVLDRQGWWRTEVSSSQAARPILLSGFNRLTSVLEDCCNRRRLRVVPASSTERAAEALAAGRGWMAVRTVLRGAPDVLRLEASYPNGCSLVVSAPASLDWHSVSHAFLDLAIDEEQGEVRLKSAKPCNQREYELEHLPGAVLRAG